MFKEFNEEMKKTLEAMPDEVKAAGLKLNQAIRRLRKAQTQFDLWKKELQNAEQERQIIEEDYVNVTVRWDVRTNTMLPLEELKP